jgi:hypothetical protein
VSFRVFEIRIHPKSHIGELRCCYRRSTLLTNGDELQSVYLAEVGRPFAAALFRLIGDEANKVADVAKEFVVHMSPSREPVNDMRTGSKSTFARTPRSPTLKPNPSSRRARGRRRFRANVHGVERERILDGTARAANRYASLGTAFEGAIGDPKDSQLGHSLRS